MLWLWKMIAAWKQLCRRFWYAWRRFSTICHVLGWHCSWEPNLLAQLYPTYVVCENDLQKAGTNYNNILHNDRIWHYCAMRWIRQCFWGWLSADGVEWAVRADAVTSAGCTHGDCIFDPNSLHRCLGKIYTNVGSRATKQLIRALLYELHAQIVE